MAQAAQSQVGASDEPGPDRGSQAIGVRRIGQGSREEQAGAPARSGTVVLPKIGDGEKGRGVEGRQDVVERWKIGGGGKERRVLHFKGAFDDGVPEGMGPNDTEQMNVYETLKATDKNYDKMLQVANDILRTQ